MAPGEYSLGMKAGQADGSYRTLANTFRRAFDSCRVRPRKVRPRPLKRAP